MTLNSFHTAGCATHGVTTGIPRLKELLDVSKNPKTPYTTVRFHRPYASSDSFARYVADTLPLTRLGDVVSRCDILFDPDPTATTVAERVDGLCRDDAGHDARTPACHVVRLTLHQTVMKTRQLTPPMVRGLDGGWAGARRSHPPRPTSNGSCACALDVADMVERGGLAPTTRPSCATAPRLLDTVVLWATRTSRAPWRPGAARRDGHRRHVVHAHGTFPSTARVALRRLAPVHLQRRLQGVPDAGRRAAAHVLFDQLKGVVSYDGSYVDDRHLLMIVDTMCRAGAHAAEPHGINRTDARRSCARP